MNQSPEYQAGVTAAYYEDRRFAGYQPGRFENLHDRLNFVRGYLSVSPNCAQAQADERKLERETAPVVDRPLVYEPDGNVLFAPEPVRRR